MLNHTHTTLGGLERGQRMRHAAISAVYLIRRVRSNRAGVACIAPFCHSAPCHTHLPHPHHDMSVKRATAKPKTRLRGNLQCSPPPLQPPVRSPACSRPSPLCSTRQPHTHTNVGCGLERGQRMRHAAISDLIRRVTFESCRCRSEFGLFATPLLATPIRTSSS